MAPGEAVGSIQGTSSGLVSALPLSAVCRTLSDTRAPHRRSPVVAARLCERRRTFTCRHGQGWQARSTNHASMRDEQWLKRLIENAQDMVYRMRLVPARGMEYAAGAVEAITGHSPAEFYADPELVK